ALATPMTNIPGPHKDPYANKTQSLDLRVIESTLNPVYRAKNNVVELHAEYLVTPALTFSSETGYNNDFLWSTEDYNRFNTQPGIFSYSPGNEGFTFGKLTEPDGNYVCTDGSYSAGGNHCAVDAANAVATGY